MELADTIDFASLLILSFFISPILHISSISLLLLPSLPLLSSFAISHHLFLSHSHSPSPSSFFSFFLYLFLLPFLLCSFHYCFLFLLLPSPTLIPPPLPPTPSSLNTWYWINPSNHPSYHLAHFTEGENYGTLNRPKHSNTGTQQVKELCYKPQLSDSKVYLLPTCQVRRQGFYEPGWIGSERRTDKYENRNRNSSEQIG